MGMSMLSFIRSKGEGSKQQEGRRAKEKRQRVQRVEES